MVKINDFWIALIGQGLFDHGESEYRGPKTLGSFLKAKELNASFIKSKFQSQKDPS